MKSSHKWFFVSLITIGLAAGALESKAEQSINESEAWNADEFGAAEFQGALAGKKIPGRPPRGGSGYSSGSNNYYSDGSSGYTSGSNTYYSDGTSSYSSGSNVYYSDGRSSYTSGSNTYYSDGRSSYTSGSNTYYSDGTSCYHSGSNEYCS
jgi:hypothetical protein